MRRRSYLILPFVSATFGLQACSNGAPTPAPAAAPPTVAAAEPTAAPASVAEAPPTAPPAAPVTEAPIEPVEVAATLTDAQRDTADRLVSDILANRLNRLATRSPDYGAIFLELAARHPRAPVVAAALDGMARTWRRVGRGDAKVVDDDFRAVVRARLASKNALVRGGAVTAARLLVGEEVPDEATLATALETLRTGTAADRVAIAGLLINVRAFQLAKAAKGDAQGRVVDAMMAALAAEEPYVQAVVLDQLAKAAFPGLPQRAALKAAAEARIGHEEPGVRGPAALLLAGVVTPDEVDAAARAILPGLSHANAYVRGASAEALGRLGFKAAAHGIMPLVDQTDSVVHVLGGFTALDGQPGQVELLLAGGRTLDAVALNALRAATKRGFDFKGGVTPASRDEVVARAKAWYAAQKAKLPTP